MDSTLCVEYLNTLENIVIPQSPKPNIFTRQQFKSIVKILKIKDAEGFKKKWNIVFSERIPDLVI